MPNVTETVEIAAPAEKVFEFVVEPERATMFLPGLNRISNVSTAQPGVGQTWDYEFNWFGLVILGKSECKQFKKPHEYQFQTQTGARSTWTYRFDPNGKHTRLTLEVAYELPRDLVTRVAAEGILEKMNQNRAREAVANVKALLEP